MGSATARRPKLLIAQTPEAFAMTLCCDAQGLLGLTRGSVQEEAFASQGTKELSRVSSGFEEEASAELIASPIAICSNVDARLLTSWFRAVLLKRDEAHPKETPLV